MKPAIYLVREVHFIDQEGNTYSTKEKILQEKGFLSVFQEDIEEGQLKHSRYLFYKKEILSESFSMT